ncbi:hypothetical protein [Orlajensenia leifsoniae]|uniref:Uncharacterized protein n=1 Tax=Orlajensenia leifsoniae TaxID=2561933 RepID=A0A4Y9QYL4_9MICO|nr:hypothetical protein [Leifsonia flava]TFV96722.1 hypothetical protein E4M00_11605 [Leifsonia flava]
MSARDWSGDPATLARRRGVLGMIVGAVLLLASLVPLGGGLSPTITAYAIAVLVLAVLVFVVSGIALSIGRRYPAVRHLGGPNDLATVLAIVVGVLAGVLVMVFSLGQAGTALLGAAMLVVVLAIMTGAVLVLSSANRTAIRSEAATGPRA